MDLPVDILRTFVIAADVENFTAAGRVVYKSQSAVSMQMKRLEELIQCKLFERDGHMMRLTHEGLSFLWHARRILKTHDDAVRAMQQPELSGKVRLGAPEDYAERQLPQVLSQFSKAFPLVQVQVACQPCQWLEGALDKNQLDLLIRTDNAIPENGETICHEQVVWATSKKHLVHELTPLPIAVYYTDCVFREWAEKSLVGIGREYRIAYTSQSASGLLSAVRAGLAVTAVGRSSVPGDIRILGPDDGFPKLPRAVITLTKAQKSLSIPAQSLASHIISSFQDMSAEFQ
jgi:DNA-binding transcriptional LysR family regulator